MMRILYLLIFLILFLSAGETLAGKKKTIVNEFSTKSYVIATDLGEIISEKDGDTVRPIASISKLMVGLITIDQPMTELLIIPSTRTVQSSIPLGTAHLSRKELLTLALVKSDNFAAQILCSNIDNCISKMNERAALLNMSHTVFVEPTGLSSANVSTAQDLVKLAVAATNNPELANLSRMPKAEITTIANPIRVNNTNPLTASMNVILSKTGFTNPAGGCLLMVVGTDIGRKIFVLLGSRNANSRIPDAIKLVKMP